MIDTPEKLKLPTLSGPPLEVLTAWTKGAGSKFLKLRIGDTEIVIPRESFVRAAMLLGDEEEQEALIPTTKTTMRYFGKLMTLRLTKDMKQGETLQVPVRLQVPVTEEQASRAKFY